MPNTHIPCGSHNLRPIIKKRSSSISLNYAISLFNQCCSGLLDSAAVSASPASQEFSDKAVFGGEEAWELLQGHWTNCWRLNTVLSRKSLKRVELWRGRGSVDLVVLRSSLTNHLAWHSYTPSLSRRFQRCNRIDRRRSRRWHLHIAQRLPCCRSDGIINIKCVSIATESAIQDFPSTNALFCCTGKFSSITGVW